MITTICLNPSLDKTAYVDQMQPGDVNRLYDIRLDMGGKGLNVAVVAHRLGMNTQCLGILGKESTRMMEHFTVQEGLRTSFLTIEGNVRMNLKVVSKIDGQVTEFNEPGPIVTEADFILFREMVKKECVQSRYFVLTGSLPPGCNENAYSALMQDIKSVPCILDTLGRRLLDALSSNPFIVKPNLSELESTLNRKLNTLRDIRDAGNVLIEKGAQNAIISMGKAGALFTNGKKTLYAPALSVKAKSTVGAGDAMVAGMLFGLEKEDSILEAFRCGIAAGAASVMTEGTQLIRLEDFKALLPKVKVQGV